MGRNAGGQNEVVRGKGIFKEHRRFPSLYPFCDALFDPLSHQGGLQKGQNGLSFEPLMALRSISHGLSGFPAGSGPKPRVPETAMREYIFLF